MQSSSRTSLITVGVFAHRELVPSCCLLSNQHAVSCFCYHAWLWDFPDIWKSCEFVLPGTYSTLFGRVLPGWTLCFFQTEVSNSSTLILAVLIRAVCFRIMHFSPIERTLQVAIPVAYYSLQVPKVLLLMSNLPFIGSCCSTLWKNSYFGHLLMRQTSFPAN
jgi:hypothetical protein